VTLRARLAIVITFLLIALGMGAGLQADAAPASPTTSNNGCVVVPSLSLAFCVPRF
jgi:hypothetical protein